MDCEVLKEAGCSLDYRLAVTELASINFTWAAGISNLLHFSTASFIQFGLINNKSNIQTPDFYNRKGPAYGSQPEYLGKNQKFDWTAVSDLTVDYVLEKLSAQI